MIAIIGGGISGLSLAWHLKKYDIPFVLIERSERIGGACGSINVNDFIFDMGAHYLFEREPYAIEFVKDVLGVELTREGRRSLCYFEKRYIPFPIQSNLRKVGFCLIMKVLLSIAVIRTISFFKKPKNYSEWLISRFGVLARDFIIPNSKKKWNVSPSSVKEKKVSQKVYDCSILELLKGCFKSSWDAYNPKQGERSSSLLYPKGGMKTIVETIVEEIKDDVIVGIKVEKINTSDKKIILSNNRVIRYDHLVSTIPLQGLIKLIEDCPDHMKISAEDLLYNQMALVLIGVRGKLGDKIEKDKPHFIHFGEDFSFHRISFPKHFCEENCPENSSSIMVEICFPKSDKRYWEIPTYEMRKVNKIISELENAGIIKDADDVAFTKTIFVNPAYMLFDEASESAEKYLTSMLNTRSVSLLGRFAEWKYLDSDQCIVRAKKLADKLKLNKKLAKKTSVKEEYDLDMIKAEADKDIEIERAIANECFALRRVKTIAYKNTWKKHGFNGAAHNLLRKFNRLDSVLLKGGEQDISLDNIDIDDLAGDEGIRTTLIDLINYCFMLTHLVDEEINGRKLQ